MSDASGHQHGRSTATSSSSTASPGLTTLAPMGPPDFGQTDLPSLGGTGLLSVQTLGLPPNNERYLPSTEGPGLPNTSMPGSDISQPPLQPEINNHSQASAGEQDSSQRYQCEHCPSKPIFGSIRGANNHCVREISHRGVWKPFRCCCDTFEHTKKFSIGAHLHSCISAPQCSYRCRCSHEFLDGEEFQAHIQSCIWPCTIIQYAR